MSCCEHDHHDHNDHNEAAKCSCCCGAEHEHKQASASCCCGEKPSSVKTQYFVLIVSIISLIISFINPAQRFGVKIFHYIDPAWLALLLCGVPIVKAGFKNLFKNRKITSGLLISVAMIAAVALEMFLMFNMGHVEMHHHESYIFAAGEIAFLMTLGGMIEDYTVRKSRAGIERLVTIAPKTAYVKNGDSLVLTKVDDIKIGDIVVVKPNNMISADGVIISGKTAVDQSSMTGESLPVDKAEGDEVFGGTWNKSGAVEIRVTKLAKDMAVSKLISLVEEAEGKKAPISRLADKWAGYIVPSAIILAFVVAVVSYFLFHISVLDAVIRGVTVLVVFCPCSLALATPTAVAAGLGNAAKRGVLIKSGAALEELAKVDVMAFDKTGTLTEGQIEISDTFAYGMDEKAMLALAAAAEKYSEHPIAKAIIKGSDAQISEPEQTTSLVGIGVEAIVDGKKVLVSRWTGLESSGIDTSKAEADAKELLVCGKTVVAVCVDDVLAGIIALSDVLRKDTPAAVRAINNMDIDTIMLTGDNEQTALSVAQTSGVQKVKHSLMPDDKLRCIEELKQHGKTVCMVGDGVNDAPSLAAANCSVAMGALGSDIAIETADIALMGSDILRMPGLVELAKKVMTRIKGNITLSMSINFIAVLLSTLGLLTPVTGALVHNLSSVLVVSNSALLLTVKDRF